MKNLRLLKLQNSFWNRCFLPIGSNQRNLFSYRLEFFLTEKVQCPRRQNQELRKQELRALEDNEQRDKTDLIKKHFLLLEWRDLQQMSNWISESLYTSGSMCLTSFPFSMSVCTVMIQSLLHQCMLLGMLGTDNQSFFSSQVSRTREDHLRILTRSDLDPKTPHEHDAIIR